MESILLAVMALAGCAVGLLLAPKVKAAEKVFGNHVHKLWQAGALSTADVRLWFDAETAACAAKTRGLIADARLAELELVDKLGHYPSSVRASIEAELSKFV